MLPTPLPLKRGTYAQLHGCAWFDYPTLTVCGAGSHLLRLPSLVHVWCCHTTSPGVQPVWNIGRQATQFHTFRLVRVRSPLLTQSRCFLFLRVLRWFSSPSALHITRDAVPLAREAGCPIRRPADRDGWLLPAVFAAIQRPSSADCA